MKKLTRNAGKWTESQFEAHIIGCLRDATQYWQPANLALRKARAGKELYQCAICRKIGPQYLLPLPGKKRKRNNAVKDHIEPIVCPVQGSRRKDGSGLMDWNRWIDRAFIEVGYQILCYSCNLEKCNKEKALRKLHKDK